MSLRTGDLARQAWLVQYAYQHRSHQVQQTVTAITTDRGAVIVGLAGTGRTTLVEIVTGQLPANRYAVTRTTATEASRTIPFGLFCHLFPVAGDSALVPSRLRA